MAVTPIPALATVVSTGAAPYTVFAPGPLGGVIQNPLQAADQGISAVEPLLIDPTGSNPTLANNGTTFAIQPGEIWNVIPSQATATKVTSVTSGHKFAGVSW